MKSLRETAMRVSLNMGQWTGRKRDRKVSNEVDQIHNTFNAGRYDKFLIDPYCIKPVAKISQRARLDHYKYTNPWSDDGWRLLPVKLFPKYSEVMRKHEFDFDKIKNDFCTNYTQMIGEARTRLNGMFNSNDYPDPQIIESKFYFKVNVDPVPDSGHFLIDLSNRQFAELKADVDLRVKRAVEEATKDVWRRLREVGTHLKDRLGKSERFHKTNITNIQELCKILPDLNLSEDQNLNNLADELCNKASSIMVETVKVDERYRNQKREEIEKVINKMDAFI